MFDGKRFSLMLLILSALKSVVFGDQPPRFVLSENEILLHLREGPETPIGSRIYTLRGEDPDGDPLQFGVRGQMGNDLLRLESVNKTAADIFLVRELDREIQDSYQLILTLTDGHPGNTIEQSMYILVEDINDNQPVFKPYNATVHLKEGSQPGIICSLEATDLDEGIFGQVLYSLQESDDGMSGNFMVETINGAGVLSLVRQLDFEEKYLYQLQVLATDRSNVPGGRHTGTAAIVIKVEDIEDQPPEFIKIPSVTKVPEDLPVGSRITQVWAVDGDRGINNEVHYSIVDGDNDLFGIERETGWVFVKNRLDREASDSNGAYILKMQAQEIGSKVQPVPSTFTEVTVLLTDINDETPRFRSQFYVGEVSENTQLNVPVTFLGDSRPEVYDYDQGKNGTFLLYLSGDDSAFDITPAEVINEATFLIRVKNHSLLDYENKKRLDFQIIARETVDVAPKSTNASVTIYIRDANDNIPEFEAANYVAHIPENAGPGTFIVRIAAADLDSGNFGTSGIRYTEIRGHVASMLSLDPLSGNVTVRSSGNEFDREQFSTHYLTVEARDNLGRGNRNTVQLQLVIDDVNDNAPEFLQDRFELRIMENSAKFPRPFYVEAFDRDVENSLNQMIRYSIVDGDLKNNFSINETSGEIVPRFPLDYEALEGVRELRLFNLTIRAEDRGIPPLSNNVSIIVYVQDKNDHSPVFLEPSYATVVREDIRSGDPIVQVHARDGDGSVSHSRVVYRIVSGSYGKFVIHSDKGVISVAHGANLDPDLTDPKTVLYLLQVAAIDGGIGDEQRQAFVTVNVSVTDVNNKAPEFQNPGTVHVEENSASGTIIGRLSAIDRDSNPDLRFSLDSADCEARNEDGALVRLSSSDIENMFEVNTQGVVRINGIVDREHVETVKLKVKVEDRNAVGLRQTASGVLNVEIDDVNDNDPVFKKLFYKKALPENSAPGTPILTIVADDRDVNRTLLYALRGSANVIHHVILDQLSGEIVVGDKVDREQYSWLNFSVVATDSGIPPRSATAKVAIQILDENDNNPVFSNVTYSFELAETSVVGTEIAKIVATDADIGDYGKVTYLLDKRTTEGKFFIHPDTGVLSVADVLDREAKASYSLVVEAWDNYELGFATGESRKAFEQITITIVDVNDNAPQLKVINHCAFATEYHGIGETVVVVKAEDGDDPKTPNAHVDFAIVEGNQRNLFSLEPIDRTSARLLAAKSLKQQIGNHTLAIVVQDRGSPSLSGNGQLIVCVADFNDHAPRFIKPFQNQTIRISEDTNVGAEVVHVNAVDDDMGLNGQVKYKILEDSKGDWKAFKIDPETGVVTLKQPLDREVQKRYEIRVESYDLGTPTPLASDIDLVFYVKNVVDVEPHFTHSEVEIGFTENSIPNLEKQILPETVDTEEYEADGVNATVCYFIVGGNENKTFYVHPVEHTVTTTTLLDREEKEVHQFVVKASKDCQTQPYKMKLDGLGDRSLVRVVVKVLDVNDNKPRFSRELYTGGMNTDSTFGTAVLHVSATDADLGMNGLVQYSIVGPIRSTLSSEIMDFKLAPFTINRTSGVVSLNFYPQKTMKGYFHFKMLAKDSGGLNDTALAMIYLVRDDQKVTFTLRLAPDELHPRIDKFQRILSNLTGAIVNIDLSKYHENKDGSVDRTKTDVLTHFVQKEDNSIMNVKDVIELIDNKIEALNSLFREFNVLECKPTISFQSESDQEEIIVAWLIGSTTSLGVFLILAIFMCVAQRNRYERRLKAATAMAFGSQASSLNRTSVPNTNQHSIEGSNPIWMHSYENEWYKETDSLSSDSHTTSDSNNSLDENVINSTDDTSQSTASPISHEYNNGLVPHGDGDSCVSSNFALDNGGVLCTSVLCIQQQNDLNKLQRHNIYDSLGLNSNAILAHLETTEL